MSRKENLVSRLKSRPRDFSIQELDTLMSLCNCEKRNRGKTSGSAIEYIHTQTKHIYSIHQPHPGNEIKICYIKRIISFLTEIGEIQDHADVGEETSRGKL